MQLEHEAASVPLARATTRTFFSDCVGPQRVGSLELIVSELVTNSILHAGEGSVGLRLAAGKELLIEVVDGAPGQTQPHVRRPPDGDTGGHGLQLVAALCEAWGSEVRGEGRVVWASMQA